MKKLLILFILLLFAGTDLAYAIDISFAQKISGVWQTVPSGSTIYVSCRQDSAIDTYFGVKNNTSQALCIWMMKAYIQQPLDTFNDVFCWDNCYPKQTKKSAGCITYNSGQARYMDFRVEFNPIGKPCECIMKYSFWPTGIADTAWVIVHFVSRPLGIENPQYPSYAEALPNPSNGKLSFSAPGSSNSLSYIIVTDILGKRVKTIGISPGANQVNADLTELPDGIYLYFIQSQNKTGIVRKLVLRH